MEDMRDIEKFQLMCNRVAELSEEVSKLTAMNGALLQDLRNARLESNTERDILEARHNRERADWQGQMASLKSFYEDQIDKLRKDHKEYTELLMSKIQSLELMLKSGRKKLFGGGKSEKMSAINKKSKREEEHRDDEENRFDGTGDSLKDNGSSTETSAKSESDVIKKIQRDIKRKNINAEVIVERVDYSKAEHYSDNVIYHSLEENFQLSEGERYEVRNGEIVKTLVKVIVRYPAVVEEHIYECARVICKDKEDYSTSEKMEGIIPANKSIFDNSMLSYILDEKFHRNKPLTQIVEQLNEIGFKISNSTLGDNIHRSLSWMLGKIMPCWEKVIRAAKYLMLDETPLVVGCKVNEEDENRVKRYLKKYMWCIRANIERMVMFVYEGGRGAKVIEPYLKDFIGFYTTDGYQVYKIFDDGRDDKLSKSEKKRLRSACLTHIRRYFVDAIPENKEESMWFIEQIGKLFEIEYHCKKNNITGEARLLERLKRGSTITIMEIIESRLRSWEERDYVGSGPLLKKALIYALNEWQSMKCVLQSGDVELSNNLAEQMMRRIKMNLKTATNIGSEESAKHNAFIYSLIESCKLNNIAPIRYMKYLLDHLTAKEQSEEELMRLLPCNCAVALA